MPDLRQKVNRRFDSLKAESKRDWEKSWSDLSTYIAPSRGRFKDQYNRGKMIDHKTVLDAHATQAQRILGSGMLSGMSSQDRPWFRLTVDNVVLNQISGVREWLDEIQKRMLAVLNGSNIYSVLQSTYEEIGTFGTACFIVLEDFNDVIRARNFTIGEYYLGTNSQGRANAFARELWMTTAQLIEEFGKDRVSSTVLADYENGKLEQWYKVKHLIEVNDDRISDKQDFENMPFRSVYWEDGRDNNNILAKRGFKRFPVLAPRWETITTDDIYGHGPGWNALGNVKQLQKTVLDKLLAQEKIHNPPMLKDASVEGYVNLLPGGVSTTSGNVPNAGVRPAFQINPNLDSYIEAINTLKEAIDRDYFVNLFLMLMNIDKTNMTATEIAERQQEKVMMMGPILHRLQEELLDPLVELVYGLMEDNGLLPPPPQEILENPALQGIDIKVQYVSILAQAQRAIGVNQIERVIGFVANSAQLEPSVLDMIDFDETTREIADMEGIPAKLVREPEQIAEIRAQRKQQEQMQQALAAAEPVSKAIKNIAGADLEDDNVLSRTVDAAQT